VVFPVSPPGSAARRNPHPADGYSRADADPHRDSHTHPRHRVGQVKTRSTGGRTGRGIRSPRRAWLAALALAAGCSLPDLPLTGGDDVLVVEAVLRTDVAAQQVILHRSIAGRVAPGEPGARVQVRTGEGRVVEFGYAGATCFDDPLGRTGDDEIAVDAACFRSGPEEGFWVVPGGTYDLTVETPRGERVRGRTTVPGRFRFLSLPFSERHDVAPAACRIRPGTTAPLAWSRSEGAWAYVLPLRIHGLREALAPGIDAPDTLDLLGLSITAADTTIRFPTEFGVFDRFREDPALLLALQGGLPAGVYAHVSVAAADRNYVNGVRGGSFNPSGQVRISSVAGDGVGVFGALVPLRAEVRAEAGEDAPPGCLLQ
jgi:hypothetical protein